ncbi:aminoglycoside phosphotransferase, partial [Rhodospirillum rubrum]|nr:aminoglycoside phosphotransferase [Rhodospirillum rubrum]
MVLLLEDDTTLSVTPLDSGLEAEVMKISSPESDFVLKV